MSVDPDGSYDETQAIIGRSEDWVEHNWPNQETLQRLDQVERQLEEVQQKSRQAKYERNHMMEHSNHQTNWDANEIFKAVTLAAFGIGAIGLLGALVSGGYGFVPLFIVGMTFLVFAYKHGLPNAS